jgi:hypothetical protein
MHQKETSWLLNNKLLVTINYYHDFGDSNVIVGPVFVGKDNLCACNRSVLTESFDFDDVETPFGLSSDSVVDKSAPTHAIGESPYKESPTIPLPTAAQCIRS